MADSDEVKICKICHQDCSNAPRYRTDLGEYVHQSCYEEDPALANERSEGSDELNDTDELSWDWFHYCLPCNRPWELEKFEVRQRWVREVIEGTDHHLHEGPTRYRKVLREFYHCKKCGTEARSGNNGMGKLGFSLIALLLFTLGCQIFHFSYFLGFDLSYMDNLTRNSLSFVLVLLSILIAATHLIINPRSQKRLQKIHTEWARQYGIDPKNWPNP